MYTLFGYQGSGSAAVEMALEMAGAPYRIVAAASWAPDSAIEALREVNPLLQIPTLQLPDGTVLTESAAILIHLGLSHPDSGLLPAEPSARAMAIRSLVYIAANCYAAISIGDFPERWCEPADEATVERVRAGARRRLYAHWAIFADTFPARPYLNGAAPGALDMLAVVVSKWSGTRPYLAAERPAFSALLTRLEAHPCCAPVMVRHWPAPSSA